jgi:ABC-type multidrug transport system fused ATPase/permease subunit
MAKFGSRLIRDENDRETLRWIWQLTLGTRHYCVVLGIVQIIQALLSVLSALILKSLIDYAVAGSMQGFIVWSIVLVVFLVVMTVLDAITRYYGELSRSTYENRFKSRFFDALLSKDFGSVEVIHSGEWMNRLTSDTKVVAENITSLIPELLGTIAKLIGAIVVLLIMQPLFAYILIPCGILMLVLSFGFRKIMKRLHKRIQEADGKLRVFMQERLSNLLVVHAFQRESETSSASKVFMSAHKEERMHRNHFSNVCNTGLATIMRGAYGAAAIYCGFGILMGSLTYGTFTAVLQLVNQVQSPFMRLSGVVPAFYAMLASAERLMEVEALREHQAADTTVAIATSAAQSAPADFASFGISNATFSYLRILQAEESNASEVLRALLNEEYSSVSLIEQPVFKDMSFEAKRGEFIALTGESGCGKSTLLKLLMGVYHLRQGECYVVDSQGARHELNSQQAKMFAYVPQGNQLMSGTIREMIAFGNTELANDDDSIWNALDVACARGFVEQLEHGIDANLGESGTGLSEGQMQRLSIARAIASERPVLLLDECTSALDGAIEKRVLENLRALSEKTVLIVTHRPAALDVCDRSVNFECTL